MALRGETSLDIPLHRAQLLVREAHRRGLEVSSVAIHGDDHQRASVTLQPALLPREESLELGLDLARADALAFSNARRGIHPSRIAFYGSRRLAIVWRNDPAHPSKLVGPRPLRDVAGRLFFEIDPLAVDPGYRVVDVAGFLGEDGRARILAVAKASDQRIRWAVHLDAVPPSAWPENAASRALARCARPVRALPLSADCVLSLWHDSRLELWPLEHPFSARNLVGLGGTDASALAQAAAERATAEDRVLVSVGFHEDAGFVGVWGASGREIPLERAFSFVSCEPPCRFADRSSEDPADHTELDALVAEIMRTTGARHAQLAIVRGAALAFDRAYTFAEEGYPNADCEHAMRVGSVSKVLTTLAAQSVLGGDFEPEALDAPLALEREHQARSHAQDVTIRRLLTHRSGLRTVPTIRFDEPEHELSELALARAAGRRAAVALPGDMIAWLCGPDGGRAFTALADAAPPYDYANDGFTVLGELLAERDCGDAGAFEKLLCERVFAPAGIDLGSRGAVFASGARAAVARHESPPEPSSPSWGPRRFDDLAACELTLPPWTLNGAFLGGASGIALPARILALVVARRGPSASWSAAAIRRLIEPTPGHDRQVLGLLRAPPAYWSAFDPQRGLVSCPVERVYHNGQIEGGAALLVHQFPRDFATAPQGAGITTALVVSQVAPLFFETVGQRLLATIARMERSRRG